MKKLIILLVLATAAVAASAQRTVIDTLQGAETVIFTTMQGAEQIQALCTQLGGTSDGSLILKGSVDGVSFETVSETSGKFAFYPNDTLTITDGAVWLVDVEDQPFNYYSITGAGTADDTTKVTIKWSR